MFNKFMKNKQKTWLQAFETILIICSIILNFRGIYYNNQNSYYPFGLKLSGAEYLFNDWYSNTQPLHIAFAYLVKVLALGSYYPILVFIFETLLVGVFWFSIRLLLKKIKTDSLWSEYIIEFAIIVYLIVSLIKYTPIQQILQKTGASAFPIFGFETFSGFAGQAILSYCLLPSEFGIFLLLGLVFMIVGKHTWGSIALAIASIFHFSYLSHSAFIISIVLVGLLRSRKYREAALVLGLFIVPIMPLIAYYVTNFYDPSNAALANQILYSYRIPHHANPRTWFDFPEIVRSAVLMLGLMLMYPRIDKNTKFMLTGITLYLFTGIVFVAITQNHWVGLFFPWRISSVLYPIAFAVVIYHLIKQVFSINLKIFLSSGIIIFSLVTGFFVKISLDKVFSQEPFFVLDQRDVYAQVQKITKSTDIILTPPKYDEGFRLMALRSIYVDYKSHPYKPVDVIEWWKRNEQVIAFYKTDTFDERNTLCASMNVDYYLMPNKQLLTEEIYSKINEEYSLVRCMQE